MSQGQTASSSSSQGCLSEVACNQALKIMCNAAALSVMACTSMRKIHDLGVHLSYVCFSMASSDVGLFWSSPEL